MYTTVSGSKNEFAAQIVDRV
jgi:hypothetical protein